MVGFVQGKPFASLSLAPGSHVERALGFLLTLKRMFCASLFNLPPWQVCGRNFILFLVLGGAEEMQSKAVVFFIFYIWSMVEIFRYWVVFFYADRNSLLSLCI